MEKKMMLTNYVFIGLLVYYLLYYIDLLVYFDLNI